jgi:hypothetical protein
VPDVSEDQRAVRGRNRLAGETSPYLLQHAGNPVDWYPWGDEAFARARAEARPILLSVGYSSCHWCHVMAHESFENEAIAAQMNEGFVNIKVDREERPDVDAVYMSVTQALTGSGGWPMTVFLTPDLEAFYAGTYYPPDDSHGRPGFPRLLTAITNAWNNDRENLTESAANITARLREANTSEAADPGAALTEALTDSAVETMRGLYDARWGGFGGAPKFPSPGNLEFLLMHDARVVDGGQRPSAREMVIETLRKMWAGGMYDHLGGGFSRYSVDAKWLVPHFEKMLYDNAQLVRVYLHAFQLTGDPFFELVVRETLAYLEREMRSSEGGSYAAQDADSEGIEGKFFVWTVDEIDGALGAEDAAIVRDVFAITAGGNFFDPHHPELRGRNVLSRPRPLEELAAERSEDAAALEQAINRIRARLFEVRSERVPPGLDDKVLVSWNGLMLSALAEAGRVLGDRSYIRLAEENVAFVRASCWREGRLLHTWKDGIARVDGLLEDYAYYALGLIELYAATGELAHLEWARELFEQILARFADPDGPLFFETPEDGEQLILRQRPLFDAPTPSGNGATALLAARLARYLGEPAWDRVARGVVVAIQDRVRQAPTGFGSTLQAAELLLAPHREIAIVGPPEARGPFERALAPRFLPAVTIAPAAGAGGIPLLEDRGVPTGSPSGAAAFLCRDFVCELPTTSVEDFAAQLDQLAVSH